MGDHLWACIPRPIESHSGARGKHSRGALLQFAVSFRLKHPANFWPGKLPTPFPLSTGSSFATHQLEDRGLEPDIHRTRRRQIDHTVHHTCTVAAAYTFSDVFFSYKLEHTSIVVILTLTEQWHTILYSTLYLLLLQVTILQDQFCCRINEPYSKNFYFWATAAPKCCGARETSPLPSPLNGPGYTTSVTKTTCSTQRCIPLGLLNWVPALIGWVKVGMLPVLAHSSEACLWSGCVLFV